VPVDVADAHATSGDGSRFRVAELAAALCLAKTPQQPQGYRASVLMMDEL